MYNLSLATGKQWQFHAWAGAGTLYLDEYREFNGGAGVTPDERMQFTYDALDRLVSTHKTTSEGYDQDFSYDPIGNLQTTSRTGNYWYASSVSNCAAGTPARKPHAVTSVEAGGGMVVYGDYAYDCNGNMTSRMELLPGGQAVTYAETWDAENRLTVVTNTATTPNAISKFVYDGDGARVMQIQISGTQMITTAYAGAIEVQITATQRITKSYYSAGSQLIAERVYTAPNNSVLYFLHTDHLGSASLTTNASGGFVARQLYG